MPSYFCISIRFLDATYHGRRDGAEPEWPPSPLRVFQALIPAAAALWRGSDFHHIAVPALTWLERLNPPEIVAPAAVPGRTSYRLYVPNNAADEVAAAWKREAKVAKRSPSPRSIRSPIIGAEKLARRMADHRTEKDVRPTWLHGGEMERSVYYVWAFDDQPSPQLECWMRMLSAAARGISHVGWGVDQVVGDGRQLVLEENEALDLKGYRWRQASSGGVALRAPTVGTLAELRSRYDRFLHRVSDDGRTFAAVPPLTKFKPTRYHAPTLPSVTEHPIRPFVAFELRTPDFEQSQPFDPTRHACAVAGMVRHALANLARQMRPFGWTDAEINTFIHGHSADGQGPARGLNADHRFAYLPLPSLERRGTAAAVVTGIRRVLVVGPPNGGQEVAWARVLSGCELTPLNDRTLPAALRLIDRPPAVLRIDPNIGPYLGSGIVWSTVTPVVMPGHDDPGHLRQKAAHTRDPDAKKRLLVRMNRRAEALLRKAFEQTGLPAELVRAATVEWRAAGFRAGVDLARHYRLPESPKKLPAYHVRVRFPVAINGPLAVGAGRYRGMGVFAVEA
jgi:CRISPR-associated protein Csb2